MMNEWIISSSILIAAMLLGRRLLRGKISLRLQYALWAVVLVRLLLPVQLFTSDYGAGTIARDVDISAPVRQVYISANEDRYEREYADAYRWASAAYGASGQSADPIVIEKTAQQMAQTTLEVDLKGLLTRIWLGGMGMMTAVIAFCNLHLSRRLKRSRQECPVSGCLLPVYVTGALPTPCIFGLFLPAIYLTPDAARDEKIRSHVLAHEQTHYRHGDHIWSVLRSLCLVLHWYNPLVWLAVKASKTDAELACDEGVLARLGEDQRGDYGRTLIGLTCAAPMGDFLLTATTMTGSIRERIKLLMQRPRNTLLTLTAVVLIGTLVVGCSFAGAPEKTPDPQPPETIPAESTGPNSQLTDPPLAPIHCDYAPEDFNPYHAYRCDETDHITSLGFTAAETLTDVKFGLLDWFDAVGWQMTDVACTIDSMDPDQPFLAQVVFWGDMTTYGISFTDARGMARHYAISISGEDGSLVCREYVPDPDGPTLSGPGSTSQFFFALPMEQAILEYADRNPRELNEEELKAFRAAFATLLDGNTANAAACFLYPYYDDITEMDGSEFLAYFPGSTEATREEFDLLKAKYPAFFADWTFETMPIPIHRYEAAEIEAVISRYANIHWAELDEGVHYLEETGCYYNYTSDFGLGGFYARGGFVYDGGAVVYSDFSALFFTETMGSYTIQAHLPALVPTTHYSHPMIPADG